MLHDNLYPYENDRTIVGKTVVTKGTNINIRSGASTASSVIKNVAASGTALGKATGRVWYDTNPAYKWYEVDGSPYMYIRNDLATLTGEAKATASTTTAKSSDAEAQQMMDEIVSQDKETMNNLNNAAAMIEQLKAKGVSTTASANKLTVIFNRLQERQEAMKKTTWGKVKDTISNAWGSVKNFFGFSGLGVLPVVIIAGVALVAGAGATALVTLKPWKNQSTIDLKESKELKNLLDNADPVVAEKIRTDIKEQLVDAYTTGNRQGSFSSVWNIGKYVFAGVLALWLVPKAMDMLNKR